MRIRSLGHPGFLLLVVAATGAGVAVSVLASRPSAAAVPSGSSLERAAATGGSTRACPIFPASNPINENISKAPVDPNSARYIASIGLDGHLHPDFGRDPAYGIPYSIVGPHQPEVPIKFNAYGAESDPGPYPIPPDAHVEGAGAPAPGPYPIPPDAHVEGAGAPGDRHVLVLQEGTCKLFELYDAVRRGRGWEAASGAVFNLRSNALRPNGWTSADAAGLPILPLLVRYDQVRSGHIEHALRVTVARTQEGFIHPATHYASDSTDPSLPPMGLRLRLKASFDLSGFHGEALVILRALKRYGLIVADNGSNWYITGAPDPHWNEAQLQELERVPGSAFQAVETGPIRR